MAKIQAFVAHSFDPLDQAKVKLITDFLDSFRPIGFVAEGAEQAEVERVSEKVRRKIIEADVFVGILTRKHPIYRGSSRFQCALHALRGATLWTTPPWILQELGYALAAGKAPILFVETPIELPALQGDLEYIPFTPDAPTEALKKASEMINGFIAKRSGVSVSVEVQTQMVSSGVTDEREAKEPEPRRPEPVDCYLEMLRAISVRDFAAAEAARDKGINLSTEIKPVFWQATYQQQRLLVGFSDAAGELEKLHAEYSDSSRPASLLADALKRLKEYEQAAKWFLEAATRSIGAAGARFAAKAAECYLELEQPSAAKKALLAEWVHLADVAVAERVVILQSLARVFRSLGDAFAALAVGEWAVTLAPGDSDFRFKQAYEYLENLEDLRLHHYCVLTEGKAADYVYNNLGVSYGRVGLPILSTKMYEEAVRQGSTLAAGNLGFNYLDAGFVEDAERVLSDAMKVKDCDAQVPKAISEIALRKKNEDQTAKDILRAAQGVREFATAYGRGLVDAPIVSNIAGVWEFPFGEIHLSAEGNVLQGQSQTEEEQSGLLSALAGSGVRSKLIAERSFEVALEGRSGRFKIGIKKLVGSSPYGTEAISGFIVFSESLDSGEIAEAQGVKIEKRYSIKRLH